MKVGIFSGSFNPIHIGHFVLANYIVEFTELDELWFLVSPQNPWKENTSLIPEEERLEMVKLAVKEYSKLKASNFEFELERPSYTYKSLQALSKAYPKKEFYLIIGADNWLAFDNWKDYEKILGEYSIYVYPRLGYDISKLACPETVKILESPVIDISSTFIRDNISDKNIKSFLPSGVYEYLKQTKWAQQH